MHLSGAKIPTGAVRLLPDANAQQLGALGLRRRFQGWHVRDFQSGPKGLGQGQDLDSQWSEEGVLCELPVTDLQDGHSG